jgi:hypothetical protein
MTLEVAVGAALLRARAAERALHDRTSPWSLEVAGHRIPAERTIGADRIIFTGVLQAPAPAEALLALLCGEDIVDVTKLQVPVGPGPGPDVWTELRHEIVVGAA